MIDLMFGRPVAPCEDCFNGWCTMNCSPRVDHPAGAGGFEPVFDAIVRDIAELPDRTSPPEWPEAMLVTADELRTILERHFGVRR